MHAGCKWAAIVDTKWQRRANTVWNRQILSQLPVTAVPPPPAAPGRGGGNTLWVRRRGGGGRYWGVWGFWLGSSAKGCVCASTAVRVSRGATCDGHRVGGVGTLPARLWGSTRVGTERAPTVCGLGAHFVRCFASAQRVDTHRRASGSLTTGKTRARA